MLKLFLTGASAVACLVAPSLARLQPRFVWNASASVPIGLYRITPMPRPQRGVLTLIAPPAALARFLAARGYVPARTPILKRIVATEGATVCRHGDTIAVSGMTRARALPHDRRGRALPTWSGCHRLRADEIFVLNAHAQASFDSRYFGPLPASSIIGRATPLWLPKARR